MESAIYLKDDNPKILEFIHNKKTLGNNAIKSYKKAIDLKDNYLDANINLGIEYKKLNKFKSAKEYFEKLIFYHLTII